MITVAVDKEQEHRQPPVKEEPPFIPAEKQPIEKTVETDFGPLEIVKDSEQNGKIKVIYKVKDGDTLPGVANKFDVSVAEIKDWNNLTSDTLQAGQKLQLTIEKTLLSKITVPPVQKVTSTTRVDGVVKATGVFTSYWGFEPIYPICNRPKLNSAWFYIWTQKLKKRKHSFYLECFLFYYNK